jgi:hypothetical protein
MGITDYSIADLPARSFRYAGAMRPGYMEECFFFAEIKAGYGQQVWRGFIPG